MSGHAAQAGMDARASRRARPRGCMPLVKRSLAWGEGAPGGSLEKARAPTWRRWALSRGLGDPIEVDP